MLKFEKPDYKVKEYIESDSYGKFEIEPLERGFGTTLGNALRRTMLSSLPGDAISSVKIDVVLRLHKEGPGEVLADDIEADVDIEILNPEQLICTLAEGGSINMEMTISNGRGYSRAEENKAKYGDNAKQNVIFIDSLYSPIERINYEVESARVGQDNNYDKLIFEVWTNGSITPEESIALASRILIEHFEILTDLNEIADETGLMSSKAEDPNQKILETSIDDLDLSVRAYNCLKRAGILNLRDLTDKSENEMMKIRNLGKKSLKEVIDKVKSMGLNFRDED